MSLLESTLAGKARKLSYTKPEIEIFLREASDTTYTTGDKIEGIVAITPWHTIGFTDISIIFQGTSRSHLLTRHVSDPVC